MVEKGDWEAEIVKRTGEGFNKDVFTDLIIPLAFNGYWALMTINYEIWVAQETSIAGECSR